MSCPLGADPGSKGKGSTSVMIARLLQAAGHRTGLFTGPHLVDFCERIRLNGQKIPEQDLIRLVQVIKPHVEELSRTMPPDHYLGPVGTVLAVALLWFREQGTDVHVLECGRGALADDVNVIENRWSVLTPVMLEHPNNLGPTLLDIAANKSGEIGQSCAPVTARMPRWKSCSNPMPALAVPGFGPGLYAVLASGLMGPFYV